MKGLRKTRGGDSGRPLFSILLLVALVLLTYGVSEAVTETTVGEVATITARDYISIRASYTGDDTTPNNTVQVDYKLSSEPTTWTPHASLPHAASPYKSVITGLTQDTPYDVRITYNDANGVIFNGTNMGTSYAVVVYGVTPSTINHNSYNLNSTKWGGSWGTYEAGSKYGEISCDTCHVRSTTNIKRLRTSITTPDSSNGSFPGDGQPVLYTRASGTIGDSGVMGQDSTGATPRASSNRICEVCHTYDATKANGVDAHPYATAATLTNHQGADATDCTSCHMHSAGFSPAGGACDSCHGAPPGSGTDTNAPSTFAASHATHYTAATPTSYTAATIRSTSSDYIFDCGVCHSNNINNHNTNETNGIVDVTLPIGGTFTAGTYAAGGDNAPPPGSVTFKNSDGTCSSVYCHGNFTGGSASTPTWGGSVACGDCHGASIATPPSGGSHSSHIASASGLQLDCDTCHSDSASGFAVNSKVYHVNQRADWKLTTADGRINDTSYSMVGSYSGSAAGTAGQDATLGTYGACANIYCHSIGQTATGAPLTGAGGEYSAPTWGTSGDGACGTCHKATGAPNLMDSGSHTKHVSSAAGNYGARFNDCNICHTGGGQNDKTKHADRTIQVNISGTWLGTYSSTPNNTPGDNVYRSCTNNYCHSDGTNAATPQPPVTALTWGSTVTCGNCHNATKSTVSSGSHSKHVNDTTQVYQYNCARCHNNTANDVSPATISTTGYSTYHVNKAKDVALQTNWGLAGSWNNPAAGQCNNVYCHSNAKPATAVNAFANPTWNTDNGTLTCGSCHGNPPAYTSGVAGTATANSHVQHVTDHGIGCQKCHFNTTQDGSTIRSDITPSNHADGSSITTGNATEDVVFEDTGTYTYGAGSKTCSATYCHGTPATLPQWGANGTLNCSSCHQSQGAGGTASYAPNHQTHVNTAGYDFSCEMCHNATGGTVITHTGGPATGTNPGGDTIGANQTAQIQFNADGTGAFVSGVQYLTSASTYRYRSLANDPYNSEAAVTPTYADGAASAPDSQNSGITYTTNGTCNNVWCHSDAKPLGAGSTTFKSVAWNASIDCSSCHGAAGGSSAHATHVTTYGTTGGNTNFTCNACHANTASDNTTISSPANHVNAAKNVNFNTFVDEAGGNTAGYASPSCNNTYCHSNGQSTNGSHANFAWNAGAMSGNCTECHGAATTLSTMAHAGHVNDTDNEVGRNIGCTECHNATASANTTIDGTIGYQNHVNKLLNLRFSAAAPLNLTGDSPFYNGAQASTGTGSTKTPGAAGYNCANVYCHSDGNVNGTGGAIGFKTVAWNAGTLTCTTTACHGDGTNAHNNTDVNGGTTTARSNNSHAKHIGQNYDCTYCHNTTTSSTAVPPTTVIASGTHLDRQESLSFKSINGQTGEYNLSSNRACTNTYCHGAAASPYWGNVGSTNCSSCHQSQGAGGTASYAPNHQTHVDTAGYDFSCEMCHNATGGTVITHTAGPATGTNPGGDAIGANQTAQIQFNADGTGAFVSDTYLTSAVSYRYRSLATNPYISEGAVTPTYADGASFTTDSQNTGIKYTTNGTCSTIWCHSNANPINGSTNTYSSVTWNDGTIGCTSCHRGPEAFANMGNTGTPDRMSTAHKQHLATDRYGLNANYNCSACHSSTASSNSAISTPTNHVNAVKNWAFGAFNGVNQSGGSYAGSGGSCANTYCHSQGLATAAPFTTPVSAINWNSGTSATCTTCHSGGSRDYATYPANGATTGTGPFEQHKRHIATTATGGYNFTCDECHALTTANDSSSTLAATGYQNHVNGVKTWQFSTTIRATAVSQSGGSFTGGSSGTCTNIYCHSKGTVLSGGTYNQATNTPVTTPAWNGTLGCNGCHGESGQTDGMPAYASGAPKANSHSPHVRTSGMTCNICHNGVTTTGTTITDRTQHVDVTYDMQAGGTYAGTAVAFSAAGSPTTCSTISCHGGNNATWGATLSCDSCHSGTTDVDDFSYANGTFAKVGSTEWTTTGHGGFGTANLACTQCHTSGVAHNTPSNFFRLTNTTNTLCMNCHSSAQGATPAVDGLAHYGSKHSTTENGGNLCWDCHDPHGDAPTAMVHAKPWMRRDANGLPTRIVDANITFTTTGTEASYVRSDHLGVCQACHDSASGVTHYYRYSTYPTVATGTNGYETAHSGGSSCTDCHAHSAWQGAGSCVDCHKTGNTAGAPVVQTEFEANSHHISKAWADITNFDCVVCHAEGQISAGEVSINSAYHKNPTGTVDLVNADTRGTIYSISLASLTGRNETANLNLDTFCFSCHDSNGAVGVTALNGFSSPYAATNPFGETTNIRTNTYDQVTKSFDSGDASLDVNTAFTATRKSHHAVRGTRYTVGTGATLSFGRTLRDSGLLSSTVLLFNGTTGVADNSKLHCNDCHSTAASAHGSANEYLLQTSTSVAPTAEHTLTTYVCLKCHVLPGGAYSDGSGTHTGSGSDMVDTAGAVGGSRTAGNGSMTGIACLNCHDGGVFGGVHGVPDGTYTAGAGGSGQGTYTKRRFLPGSGLAYYDPGAGTTSAAALNVWASRGTYSLNALITPTSPNGYVYMATVDGGKTSGTQPTWPTTVGATVADGGQIWKNIGATGTVEWEWAATNATNSCYTLGGASATSGCTKHGTGTAQDARNTTRPTDY